MGRGRRRGRGAAFGAAAAAPAPQPYAAPPQPPPAATAAAPGMIEIQVPEGAVPGATLEFQLDDGRTLDVTVPEGARAGDRLQVPTDAADAPPPPPAVPRQTAPAATPETIEVQVPPGAVPGATIEFELDDGRVIDVPVPEGARWRSPASAAVARRGRAARGKHRDTGPRGRGPGRDARIYAG